jgi:bifunctional DNA-binding transcriptional regulator/antitoxin component of YhaV-PrlF toxin-antitoxin module
MPIRKLGQRRRALISKEICEELGLQEDDFVEVTSAEGVIVIRPKKLVDANAILTLEEEGVVGKGEAQLKKGKHGLWRDLKKSLAL